jgi:formylglycine-generating enzyme required for sulfatase activity
LMIDRETAAVTTPRRRAAVGVALARLGDPRPEVMDVNRMQFCYVPAGPFWMGSEDWEDNEKPQHWVEMGHSYWLGRFPVTNAQYTTFVEGGGYAEGTYWAEAKAINVWQQGKIRGWAEREPRNRPVKVSHPFDLPNHPVVGITWYEALAFSRWLTDCWRAVGWLPDGWMVRLPTEAEWEKGARGSGQVPAEPIVTSVAGLLVAPEPEVAWRNNPHSQAAYIWGSEADANRGNCEESGIDSSSAVGCFPGGVSPYGMEEMAGNVLEWLQSKYAGYEYRADDSREVIDASDNIRVLRGGFFAWDQEYMRCSFRGRLDPGNGNWLYGFRVCLSPIFLPTLVSGGP